MAGAVVALREVGTNHHHGQPAKILLSCIVCGAGLTYYNSPNGVTCETKRCIDNLPDKIQGMIDIEEARTTTDIIAEIEEQLENSLDGVDLIRKASRKVREEVESLTFDILAKANDIDSDLKKIRQMKDKLNSSLL